MKKTAIALTVSLSLMTMGLASAYHIPTQEDDPGHTARWWVMGDPIGLITCESLGLFDPINSNPTATKGIGGICYAASQDFWNETANPGPLGPEGAWNETAKKEKKEIDAANQTNDNPNGTWSFVQPYCTLRLDLVMGNATEGKCPATADKELLPDWFARVGSNAHACNGAWGQEFRYKELLAYFHGTAPNEHGVSGHVTFFVLDATALKGSYHNGKGVEKPDDGPTSKTFESCDIDGDGLISNFVGVTDDKTKDPKCPDPAVKDDKDGTPGDAKCPE